MTPRRTTEFREGEAVTTFESKSEVKRTVRDELQSRGLSETEIKDAIKRVSSAPMDQRVEVVPGMEFANWSATECVPAPTGRLTDSRFALKVAYEFLAVCVNSVIFDERLDGLRDCLRNKTELPDWIRITGLQSKQGCRPFHSILLDQRGDHAQVEVKLFGWLTWRVELLDRGILMLPNIGYRLDLTSTTHMFEVFESPKPAT